MYAENMVAVPINAELYIRIARFLEQKKIPKNTNQVIEQFLEYGLENADWKEDMFFPEMTPPSPSSELIGVYWKKLFLPDGTLLRRDYYGQQYIARIESKKIIYDGKSISPAQFARTMVASNPRVKSTNINAWNCILIKRPHDMKWLPASSLR